jgi:TonB family protein
VEGIGVFGQILARLKDWTAPGPRALAARFENPRLYAAAAAVIALHLVAIWFLAVGLVMPRGDGGAGREMQVALVPNAVPASAKIDPVPEPQMQAADPVGPAIAEPQIEIDTSAPAAGASQAAILPPRPDPAFQNGSPKLPASFAKDAVLPDVILTVQVEADGSISDTRIARSSGQAMLDRLAAQFAKAKWRFRAAMQSGKPVADWTTVLVRFAGA